MQNANSLHIRQVKQLGNRLILKEFQKIFIKQLNSHIYLHIHMHN